MQSCDALARAALRSSKPTGDRQMDYLKMFGIFVGRSPVGVVWPDAARPGPTGPGHHCILCQPTAPPPRPQVSQASPWGLGPCGTVPYGTLL